MEKNEWWKSAVGYQIYLKSFFDSNNDGVGDIAGVTNKLDYIKNLGVDFIWISPFFDSPMDDNGYDVRDYKSIYAQYGTMDDFKNLVDRAHSLGLKVVVDMVINHTSAENNWFIKSVAKATGFDDFYYWKDPRFDKDGKILPPNNWQSFFGGSAWEYNTERGQFYLRLFSKTMPDINFNSKRAVKQIQDVMEFWMNLSVDGFRMDAISHIGKAESFKDGKLNQTYKMFSNLDNAHAFLTDVLSVVKNKNIVTMGELGGEPSIQDQFKFSGAKRNELNMVFEFSHLNRFNKKTGKPDYKAIINSLKNKEKLIDMGGWSTLFWTNHDYQRLVSMYGNNKALSKSASAFATAMYLLKGTPVIYQGEELAMTGYPFKNENEFEDVNAKMLIKLATTESEKSEVLESLKKTSRDNARTIMQWNSSMYAGFSEHKPWFLVNPNYHSVNVAVEQTEEHSALNEYRKIIALRKENSEAFCFGDCTFKRAPHGVCRYIRRSGKAEYDVIVNLTDEVKKYLLPVGEIVYTNYGEVIRGELSPFEAIVLKRQVLN